MFVRQSQLAQIADVTSGAPSGGPSSLVPTKETSPRSPNEPPSGLKKPGIPTPSGAPGGAKSRLPTPGSGPTGGRSPSFTNLKLKKSQSPAGELVTQSQQARMDLNKNSVPQKKRTGG